MEYCHERYYEFMRIRIIKVILIIKRSKHNLNNEYKYISQNTQRKNTVLKKT